MVSFLPEWFKVACLPALTVCELLHLGLAVFSDYHPQGGDKALGSPSPQIRIRMTAVAGLVVVSKLEDLIGYLSGRTWCYAHDTASHPSYLC